MAYADQDLTQQNFRAMSEGLKSVRAEQQLIQEELRRIREENNTLLQEVATLRQQNGYLLARFHGTGSTS